ncbi:MAG TPA: ATP-binding protein [Myxococcales bacterium]|nr:ATP-binding protein [Myxococcales bacterium]
MTPRELFQSDDLSWLQKPDAEVESASIERKRWADKKEVARQLSAFANGGGDGGLLVLGVEKTGEIGGVDHQPVDKLLAGLAGSIDACRLEHRTVAISGRTVLMFFVPVSPRKVICTSDGRAYQRRGNTTVELSDAEIRELRFSRGEESFEDLPSAPWKPELIDQAQLQSYIEGRRQKNGLTLELTAEEALRTRKLLIETSRGLMLTNAGVLAFAKKPHDFIGGARLRLLRFEGTTESFGAERNVTKDRVFEGAIPVIVAQAEEFVRTLVREFDYLGPNGHFITEPEYPEPAWHEAIVNALVHRSYSLSNATVFVRIFDDRMEIESPGPFPGPNRERLSYPRNPNLMEALRYLELVRWQREGTRRMHEQMERFGLPPPEFSEPEGASVLVVLRNDLQRRRLRQGANTQRESWAEVAKLIGDPIALFRRKGFELWNQLVQSGQRPPGDVLAAFIRTLLRPDLPEDHRLIDYPRNFAAALPKPELDALVRAFTDGFFARYPNLEAQVAEFLRESPDARNQLLSWLETIPPTANGVGPLVRQIDLALGVLRADLDSPQLPAREQVERVLSALQKHSAAPSARRIYEEITGHPLK